MPFLFTGVSSVRIRLIVGITAALTQFCLSPDLAQAQTTALYLDSQPGDYIGAGIQHLYTQADATFTVHGNVSVSVIGPSYSFWWYLDFAAAGNVPLAPGVYEFGTRFPFTIFNGLNVSGSGRGCNTLTGRYVVLEVAYNVDGTVDRFAADVEQHCEDADPGLFAAIRFNSTISDTTPFGGNYPRYELVLALPSHGRVDGAGMACGGGQSDCDVILGAPAVATVTATPDPGYTFTGWTGACHGARTTKVHVNLLKHCGATFAPIQPPAPQTLLRWYSAPGDYIGGGHPDIYSSSNSVWSIQRTGAGNGLDIFIASIGDVDESQWFLRFRAPQGDVLQPGVYANATRAGFAVTTAGLDVYGNGRGCNQVVGSFILHEIEVQPGTDTVTRLAIDFEQHCENGAAPPLAGRLRFNSTLDTREHQIELTSSAAAVSGVHRPITWSAGATIDGDLEYSYYLYSNNTGWARVKDYSRDPTFSWMPTRADIGTHFVQVWARVSGSNEPYEAYTGGAVTIVDVARPTVTGIAISGTQPIPAGQFVTFTTNASGSNPLEYKFVRLDSDGWKVVRDYSTLPTYRWLPAVADIGSHVLQVWVRDIGSPDFYETYAAVSFVVAPPDPVNVALTNGQVATVPAGHTFSWIPLTTGGVAPLQCRFVRLDSNVWREVQSYGPCRPFTWTPSAADVGEHALQLWVRNAGSTNLFDAWIGTSTFRVVIEPLGTPLLSASAVFPVPAQSLVRWKVNVPGGTPALTYQFWVWRSGPGWMLFQDYALSDTLSWQPFADGTYVVQAFVRNAGTTTGYDAVANSGYFTIGSGSPARMVNVTSDLPLPTAAGSRITWTAVASGGTSGPLMYQWMRFNLQTGVWSVVQPWSIVNQYQWQSTPSDSGDYVLQVWVKSSSTTAAYDDWAATGTFSLR